ncbi:MAG: ADP-ribosylglycohydrolase family protein, partial [Acidimicrobiales bacterium]
AVREGRLDGIDDGLPLLPLERRDQWSTWLDEARTRPPATFTPNGYVVTALQAALAAVHQTPVPDDEPCRHLRDALVAAVRIGNDTDTVAAIAGTLLGARWGQSAVPLRWRALLHGWPGWTANDVTRQAILAANGGRPDAHGWPFAASLLPHYEAHWSIAPVLVRLDDDPGVLLGNVFSLAGVTGVDEIVSLCRIGSDDLPAGVRAHHLHLIDTDRENPNLRFLLRDVAETIAAWRDDGRTVLVHCVAAESRTPTVGAAYLAHRLRISGSAAFDRVLQQLPRSRPRPEFRKTIQALWP